MKRFKLNRNVYFQNKHFLNEEEGYILEKSNVSYGHKMFMVIFDRQKRLLPHKIRSVKVDIIEDLKPVIILNEEDFLLL